MQHYHARRACSHKRQERQPPGSKRPCLAQQSPAPSPPAHALPAWPRGAGVFLPESPNSLIERGRREEGAAVLRRIRGVEDVSSELEDLVEAAESAATVSQAQAWRNLIKPEYRWVAGAGLWEGGAPVGGWAGGGGGRPVAWAGRLGRAAGTGERACRRARCSSMED